VPLVKEEAKVYQKSSRKGKAGEIPPIRNDLSRGT
jgi:hypothetical protein